MKNKIKTFLVIILAGIILISLAGCGEKEENDAKKENKTENSASQNQENDNETDKVDLGKWDGNVYTNDYLGMKITLPTGWTAATDKEIAELMNIGEEVLKDEGKYISEVSKLTSIYYASATEDNTGSGIIVMSEKPLGISSAENYIKALKTQLTAMTQMSYQVTDEGTANLAGTTWSTITLKESLYGVAQRYYVCEKDGAFVGIILTSANGESDLDTIAGYFE